MFYKLDVKKFMEEYYIRQGHIPPMEVIKMWDMVVSLCHMSYKRGKNGAEFAMPLGIPVIRHGTKDTIPQEGSDV